jgi:hypothetical protein
MRTKHQWNYTDGDNTKTRTIDPFSTIYLWTKWLFTARTVPIFNGYHNFGNYMRSWKCWRLPTKPTSMGLLCLSRYFEQQVANLSFPSYQSGRTAPRVKQAACIIIACFSIESFNCLFVSLCAIIIQFRSYTKVEALCTGSQIGHTQTNKYTTEHSRNRDSAVDIVTRLWVWQQKNNCTVPDRS